MKIFQNTLKEIAISNKSLLGAYKELLENGHCGDLTIEQCSILKEYFELVITFDVCKNNHDTFCDPCGKYCKGCIRIYQRYYAIKRR